MTHHETFVADGAERLAKALAALSEDEQHWWQERLTKPVPSSPTLDQPGGRGPLAWLLCWLAQDRGGAINCYLWESYEAPNHFGLRSV